MSKMPSKELSPTDSAGAREKGVDAPLVKPARPLAYVKYATRPWRLSYTRLKPLLTRPGEDMRLMLRFERFRHWSRTPVRSHRQTLSNTRLSGSLTRLILQYL